MSYIFPSGSKKVDAFSTVKKVADDNKEAVVEDFAFDAIKELPGIKDKATGLLDEIKEKVEEVAEVIQENVDESTVAKEKVEEIAAVIGEKAEEKKEEKKEEIVEDKKEEKTEEVSKEEPTEVEIEIEDEKKDVSIPGVEEKPVEEVEIDIGEEVGPEDIVKKSEEDSSCTAKSKGEFVRLAKLSPKNREAVKEYWLGLGFPKDYVEAMVRDY